MEPIFLLVHEPGTVAGETLEQLEERGRLVRSAASHEAIARSLSDGHVDLIAIADPLSAGNEEALADVLRSQHAHVPIHRFSGADPSTLVSSINELAAQFTRVPRRRGKNSAHNLVTALAGARDMEFRVLAAFNHGSAGIFRCGQR